MKKFLGPSTVCTFNKTPCTHGATKTVIKMLNSIEGWKEIIQCGQDYMYHCLIFFKLKDNLDIAYHLLTEVTQIED